MVEGCRDWLENGLVRPEAVQAATTAYFDDQDLFGQWLEEECAEPGNEHKSETVSTLFASWRAFAERAAEPAGSTKAFSERLRRAGFEPHRTPTARSFRGVRLRPVPSFHDG